MPVKISKSSRGWRYYYELVRELIDRFIQHDVGQMGGQLAYFSLLSLFPFIIYINALISSLQISGSWAIEMLSPIFPDEIVNMISSYIESISNSGSTSLLSVGIITTIYSASRSMRSLEQAINKAYDLTEKRGFFLSVLFSMALILCFGIAIIIAIVLVIFSSNLLTSILTFFHFPAEAVALIMVLKWVMVFISLFLVISILYCLMPRKKVPYKTVIPGTILAMVGFTALSLGFSTYVNYFLRFSVLYGSIGAVFLLMLWLYVAGIILVMGAELNSVTEWRYCSKD